MLEHQLVLKPQQAGSLLNAESALSVCAPEPPKHHLLESGMPEVGATAEQKAVRTDRDGCNSSG